MATLEHAETDARDVNPILASIPFFSILATISLYEFCRTGVGGLRACAGILISLIYHLGSTARSEVLILIVSLFTAVWFRSPKRAVRWGSIAMCGFFVLFFFNQLKVEKAGSRSDESVADNLPQFARGLAIYSLGSAVAFDGTVRNPHLIVNTFPVTGYFSRALNKFGFELEDPVPFLENIAVNTTFSINAYSIYFSYYEEYGMSGTLLFMGAFGFITTLIFRNASRNDPVYVLLYGLAMYCTVTSFFADFFVLEMGFWFKAFAVGVIFYRVIPAIVKHKQRAIVGRPVTV
jgi:oligosaccharide repeat unit polymerase